jgi:hypothetical protein
MSENVIVLIFGIWSINEHRYNYIHVHILSLNTGQNCKKRLANKSFENVANVKTNILKNK